MKPPSFKVPLAQLGSRPILVDVGASGDPPAIWEPIAAESIYVGFDPDKRETREAPSLGFHQAVIVNKAITDDPNRTTVPFHFTRFPYCSSTLKPKAEGVYPYLFSDYFEVERTGDVPCATLAAVLSELKLASVDWLKLDTQGTDLRIFASLPENVRSRVLALDIEPGLIHAYQGEDLFVDAHRELLREGFWLSDLNLGKTARMQRSTLEHLISKRPDLDEPLIRQAVKGTPIYCEARYFRTLEWTQAHLRHPDPFTLLWTFALADGQLGFALDVAFEYERQFGEDARMRQMEDHALSIIRSHRPSRLRSLARRVIPATLRRRLRSLLP